MIKRVTGKLRSYSRRLARRIDACRIVLFEEYDKVPAPDWDESFASHLWSAESPFARLLDANDAPVAEADRILDGELHVFDRSVNVNDADFSWHKDFMSGKLYPLAAHPIIRIKPGEGHDIIVPWELSRLQFIPTLIAAHRKTGDERYPRQFKSIVDNWVAANPLMIGVNWITGMDVAIRGLNLALGLMYFRRHLSDSLRHYAKVLWSHAQYIHKYDVLRHSGPQNNHLLASLAGLLGISLCYAGPQAEAFSDTAMTHLDNQLSLQFRSDGGNFESAINYHQLSLEAALTAGCFLQLHRMTRGDSDRAMAFSDDVRDKLAKACTLVTDYLGAFGRSPQFGDSGDSRVLICKDYFSWDPRDHSFLQELRRMAPPDNNPPQPEPECRAYPESGYGFFANRAYGICLCASPAGRSGQGGRGHNHCDKGSLVLQVAGRPVLVDSGTYCYTPDESARSAFKSSGAHNVLMLDGLEQATVRPGSFGPLDDIETHISMRGDKRAPEWTMTHTGYSRIDGLGQVGRNVKCREDRLEIQDTAAGDGEHAIEIIWHLHPDVECELGEDCVRITLDGKLLCRMLTPQGFEVEIAAGAYSPRYGVKTPASSISLSTRARLPINVQYSVLF